MIADFLFCICILLLAWNNYQLLKKMKCGDKNLRSAILDCLKNQMLAAGLINDVVSEVGKIDRKLEQHINTEISKIVSKEIREEFN